MKKSAKNISFLLAFIIGWTPVSQAYDLLTHEAINVGAARASILDARLRSELGFFKGRDETILGKRVIDWIGEGGVLEDRSLRFFNHFHNPLGSPWRNAGLNDIGSGSSSTLWGQDFSQGFSWLNARQRYLEALTGSKKTTLLTKQEREQAFADTFRMLGQVMHLIADSSVPAHVRNDAHPFGDPYEEWVEGQVGPQLDETSEQAQQRFLHAFVPSLLRPDDSFILNLPILGQDAIDAPVPIARFWDTDQYDGTNPSITLSPRIGITEYSNANFFSLDTIFADQNPREDKHFFPFPSSADVELWTDPANSRKYWRKKLATSQQPQHLAEHLATASIRTFWEQSTGVNLEKRGRLDDKVHEDYAKLLLPRAVGYSAGLLDYFFRGRLDVDLVPDPQSSDPTVVKLSGANGSPDKLDGGTLTLYADDPLTGERHAVSALDPNFTVTAASGAPVESARFQIPSDAERFVAVYKGKLGDEKPEGDFPGGVIGKVLGGVRAESIFVQGDKRMLRTVDGVFPLPASADRLQNIQWGDLDNTFAGTLSNSSNPNTPDQVIAYKINRPIGSPEKPPLEGAGGAEAISADVLKAVNFPFGLSLGVTVDYSQTIRFQQLLFMYDRIETNVWNGSFYNEFLEIRGPTQAEVILDQTFPFAQKFPVVLDRAHLCSSGCFTFGNFVSFAGPPVKPYVWKVEQVGLDAQGRLLALVRIMLTSPEDNVRKFNLRTRGGFDCQVKENPSQSADAVGRFQVGGLLRALIDVEKGEVLGVTSSSTFSPSSQIADVRFKIQQHLKRTFVGGPLAGTGEELCADPPPIFPRSDFTTVDTASFRLPTAGVLSQSLSGWFRPDIESLVSPPSDTVTEEFDFSLVYFVDFVTGTNRAVQLTVSNSFASGFLDLDGARIVHSTTSASPEPILFFTQGEHGSFNEQGLLVRWSPQSPSNTSLAFPEKLPPAGFYQLQFATSDAALIDTADPVEFEPSTLLVDFANKNIQTFPGQFLSFDYVLLDPKFLYNINDNRFHTLDSTLRATVLPRLLAPAPGVSPRSAEYHLVRLR